MYSLNILALSAVLPILVALVTLIIFRWSAVKGMSLSFFAAAIIGLIIWDLSINWVIASAIYGALQAIEIILIIFGAVLLMNYLDLSGAFSTIRLHFSKIQGDRRIQLLIIGFGFITIIEGVAGFGTPAALAAPLLIGLGFPPLAAAVFGLWFNTLNPPFGVVGIPTIYGVGSVIKEVIPVNLYSSFMTSIIRWTGFFTGLIYIFWGLLAVVLMIYWFNDVEKNKLLYALKKARAVLPFALVMGLTAGILNFAIAYFFGAELPDIIVGFFTLGLGIFLAKKNILIPSSRWDFPDSKTWPAIWSGGLSVEKKSDKEQKHSVLKSWTPYLLVAGFLIITRLPGVPLLDILKSYTITINNIFASELSVTFEPFYLPGVLPFIPVAIFTGLFFKMDLKSTKQCWFISIKRILPAAFALIVSLGMSQIMIKSTFNPGLQPGMMEALSQFIAMSTDKFFPFVSPWIGVLGGFITGSNTSSNILFSVLQFNTAQHIGFIEEIIIALQNTGGGIGNLISVLNITALTGVIGITGYEGHILRKTIIPTVISAIFTGLIGILVIYIIV